ncbi:hypothetical protein [Fluoribacter gormanii]|uniref:hypothetical protein n=1 Tax=Fluoribacter gormanii TaxID=464 RepID=UPI00104165E9|nr:hypothetical protein [Fluoribacter gormanii]
MKKLLSAVSLSFLLASNLYAGSIKCNWLDQVPLNKKDKVFTYTGISGSGQFSLSQAQDVCANNRGDLGMEILFNPAMYGVCWGTYNNQYQKNGGDWLITMYYVSTCGQ